MERTQNEKNDKAANQAWRKKPRRFAPKSRLGCKTCKIRRVKCDLSQPSCLKCSSTGRTCDGYIDLPLGHGIEAVSSHNHVNNKTERKRSCYSHQICTTTSTLQVNQGRQHGEDYLGLNSQNLGSFMVLPMARPALTNAMSFFESVSIKHLNKYQLFDEPWRRTLMFFSQTVPSVRFAATALALLHRNYIDGVFSHNDLVPDNQLQSSGDRQLLHTETPLFYYTLAIENLLNQDLIGHDSTERTAITLLVCYLFTCFDHLSGNDVQAMRHLRGGVELSRNLDKAIEQDSNSSEVQKLVCQVTSQIRRLDVQAEIFIVDWAPTDTQETTIMSRLSPSEYAFRSLDQAAEYIQMLIARAMRLQTAEPETCPTGEILPPPSPISPKGILLGQLETWSNLFENMLQLQQGNSRSCEINPEGDALITLLRLQHTVAWILISSYGPGKEMEYDAFLPQFQQCVALANDVAAVHERQSGSIKPTFTPEIGILPVLYIIGAKCRHSMVRREVLNILRRQSIREAAWTSNYTVKVLERIIEIEESGFEGGAVSKCMGQIAVWQRIEALSWIHVASEHSAPRLDITYTLCMQQEIHTESLLL